MFRFFVEEKNGDFFYLTPQILKHIHVTRISNKKFICVYQGRFFECVLLNQQAKIINEIDENHELSGPVILGAALIETKRFEWLIQKATELGVTTLIPILSKHVSKRIAKDWAKLIKRWNLIAINAAQQSFRNKAMVVANPLTFEQAVMIKSQHRFIADEQKNAQVPLNFPTNSLFLVGPEGGFSRNEIDLATNHNFQVVSLGKRILRAETASIFMLSRIIN